MPLPFVSGGNTKSANFENKQLDALKKKCRVESTRLSLGEGEGGINWANGIETCIISYMKQIASLGSMHDTGCLGLVH